MLYIVFDNGRGVSWHVGESTSWIRQKTNCIAEVQADCDELEYIGEKFPNIPIAKSLVVCWIGDLARFIARNL
jgi:hypothetical protein